MKKFIALVFVAFLTACGGGGGGGGSGFPIGVIPVTPTPVVETPAPVPAPKVCSVALFGDSILHGGYGLNFRLPIPPAVNLKLQRPNYTVEDFSYNGGNAIQALPEYLNKTYDSRIVVFEYGVNDAGNGLIYEYPMRQMLDRAKAQGKTIIITGIPTVASSFARYTEYNDIAKKLANEYGATWAGWDTIDIPKEKTMDGLHPNQEASTSLVQGMIGALDQVAPECK